MKWLRDMALHHRQSDRRAKARRGLDRSQSARLSIEALEARTLLTFHFAGTIPAGMNPTNVAVADVNGDNKADLIVNNSDGIDLLLGNGDGTFQSPRTITAGSRFLAVADLNGDGKPDLIEALSDGSGIQILLNNGDGTFRAGQMIAVGGTAITVADLNHDGKPDLILTTYTVDIGGPHGGAKVLLGNGDGTFQTPQTVATDGATNVIGVADLNGDGKLDLVTKEVLCSGINCHGEMDEVKVHLGNGDGTFRGGTVVVSASSLYNSGQYVIGGLLGDLTGNGKPDLFVCTYSTGGYYGGSGGPTSEVLLGNGDGTFQTARTLNLNLGNYPGPVALTDLNGDGKLDLVATNGGDLFVALGNGDGTFQTPSAYAARGSVAIGDVDGDGRPDLVTTDSSNNAIRLFLDGPSPNPIDFATGSTNGRVQIRKSSDASVLADFAPFGSTFTGPVNVAWGDVNGDGFRDLVVAAGAGNPQVKVYDGRAIAQGTFSAAYPDNSLLTSFFAYGLNFNVGANIAVGDIEHNGFADIVTGASIGNPQVKIYRGQAIAQHTFNSYNPDASLLASFFAYGLNFNIGVNVAAGDLNGDGFAELVTAPTAGNPDIKVYDGQHIQNVNQMVNPTGASLLAGWFAYGLNFNVGATIAIGDVQGTGIPEIVTGSTIGNPDVKAFQLTQTSNGTTSSINYANAESYKVSEFLAFDQNLNIGASVSTADYESAGRSDILVGALAGPAKYRVFRASATSGQPAVQVAEGVLAGFPSGVTISA